MDITDIHGLVDLDWSVGGLDAGLVDMDG
jgi:hypothetical protein